MESLTERVAGLSADKRELLEALLRKKRAQAAAAATIRPRSAGEPVPLSFSQERLWLIDQLEPGNPAYNMPLALRLTGALSPLLLERVFGEIVRRHEALRTTFAEHGGQPAQVIAGSEAARPTLPVVDLTPLPAAEREEAALRLARQEAGRPFDLRRGPVLRLLLLRLDAQSHLLLVNLHHIVSDGWSLGVLQREVRSLYEAFFQGASSPLPELPVQYADFALWQRNRLQGEELERQLAFWKQRLAGALPVLELPTDRPRPPVQSFRGALRTLALPPILSDVLRGLCRRKDATPFMVLLAAWAALLGRHAGQEDLVVGTPVAGRSHWELEGLIGFFVNTLALRIGMGASPSGPPTFEDLLGKVREDVLEAFSHQDLPFERLVGELVTDRSLAHAPLFQVLFSLQNTPGGELPLPGLRLAPVSLDSGVARLDLTLTLAEAPTGLSAALEYSTDLFDASTAERLLARFEILLSSALAAPETALPDLPLLLPAERQQLLVEWNDTRSAFPREACLPELFEEVAREMPDAPALVTAEGEVWSYRRLDEASNRLARRLSALGTGPETAVGLCMDRSAELIAGILAVLKAGGLYVPLDAGYPDERLAFLLQDTGARTVLVHAPTRERLAGLSPGRMQVVDIDDGDWLREDAQPIETRVPSGSLAYVIYTSGSTGRPKGVAVPHRAIVRLVRETNYVRLGPGERTGHVANISFDAATYEIWGALLTGAAVVVVPREVVLSPADFAGWIEERGITSMFLTSALFTRMSREVPGAFAGMSELLVGGEAVDPVAARTVLAGRPPRRLLNGYGPTESTTFAVWHTIRDVPEGAAGVPIGSPLANTTLYVLDRAHEAVPPGSVGELCIGGDGLARGYLNRPELTAERFLPHPWADGERLYRTGDLVRQRTDGVLDYLGRLDHQVKIRGFRIEPGEIEAVLAGHPEVRECAVLARRDSPGDARLVAYVVLDRPHSTSALSSWLRERLPEFMLPSAFVLLDALPLTPNGKLDRRALPAPEQAVAADASGAPADPVEELLAGIWSEVLGVERAGVHDSFFALGGHSLLATQVMSRVRGAFGVELPLRTLFEAATIAELARVVRESRQGRPAPPIAPVARDGGLPLSFAQQRLWLLDQLEPGSPAYNVPLALRLAGEVAPARLAGIFAEVVRRHEALRTTFHVRGDRGDHGDRPVQVIAPELRPELPVVDLSGLAAAEREATALRLALEEARQPFDLQCGPLLRLALVRLAEREHLLLVTLHHIISDGWSMGVLLREIAALSAGLPLPELPVQYADFAVWQQAWLQGEVLEAQLGYWRRQLAGAPRLLELPLDRPRPAVQTWNGARRTVTLARGLSEAVQRLGRQQGATPFMVLLAAWSVLLGRHAGQDDVLIGSPIAGRTRREIEGLIGFFVNTLVLRTGLGDAPAFGDLLMRVRQAALDGYAHQDLPFERIVEEVVGERDLAVSPLFQVLFALQNAPAGELTVPGLSLTPLSFDSGVTKFDLSLSLGEAPSGFTGALEFNTDLFDAGTAERLWARFTALLDAAAGDPSVSVADLPLLLPAEQGQLLAWNETGEAPPSELCLHELFAAQAARTPHATALIHGTERLTYAELAGRAGGIARRLLGLGIGPEARVAVCLERSPDLIAALLGVLAAGGAYVPVDPAYPEDRRAFMIEDSDAAVLWSGGEDIPSAELPVGLAAPNHLAYVIYTSGSTGRPKGVAIEHRSAVALAHWARDEFSDEELGGMLAATSVCFDLSVFEIFVPLAFGGTILLAENALALPAIPAAGTVRLLNTVPSAAAELVRSNALPASVQTVCLAGEPLPAALAARLYATGTVRRVLNLYGPSEDTTYSTGALVPRDVLREPRAPAIGRPLPGTRAWVVDRQGALAPPGVAGELWLAGAGLARGYLGRPELTAGRFTPDPFGAPGARVYRTGDLVRQRPDGALEFLGRIDHQVKVRGFRIELGEIEEVLRSHPAVRECAAVVRGDILVAYVAGSADLPDAGILRAFLGERLPEFMVPSIFVALDALPLSPNGKVDRRALPEPDRGSGRGDFIAPRTKTEETLAEVWRELLGLERVGVEDRFFELGGHSLLATQVVSRVRHVLGVDLPLRDLFRHPTIAGLAEVIDAQPVTGFAPAAPPLVPVSREGDLPLSFAQQRLWLIDQIEPGSPAYNMPFAVRLTGEASPALLERIFGEIVRRHEALRTTFALRGDRPVQVVAPELRVALPVVDLSHLPAEEREAWARRLARDEARRPFDLSNGPLLRTALVRLAARDHLLLVTLHHIVSDGWSMGVLLREIAALSAGRTLPELPVQYADFAVWQQAWLQGEVLEAQIGYWKRRLAGAPRLLELPLDRPRPAVQTYNGAQQSVALSHDLSEALQRLGRQGGTTPFMTLLAAWAVLLGRHAGQDDVLIGSPIAGRNRREIEDLIGFFVNTLVLRVEFQDAPTFGDLLGRVRQAALDGYAHQDVPFERIVEEVVSERDLAVSPLFQVLFTLQNAPAGELTVPGLSFAPVPLDGGIAKLDLSLSLGETPSGFVGSLEYNTDLFETGTAERLWARFTALLGAAAGDPSVSVADLPLLLPAERGQLVAWNETGEAPLSALCLHELFAAQAARTPHATALIHDMERLTYAELAGRAGGIAHHLLGLGIGPETRVAVCLERSPDLIAALLGVLAAGGAYVPVDPAYPEDRRAFMIEDSGAAVLWTGGEDVPSAELPVGLTAPGHLAYVIYTSGSTGRPKGVAIEHRSAVALARWARDEFSDEELGGMLAATSVCFDLSVFEIFVPLTFGGTILLAQNALALPSLPELPEAIAVRVLNTVPSAAAELVRSGGIPASVQTVCLAGEPLPAALAARLYATGTVRRVLNLYGPSEDTTYSTGALVPRDVLREPRTPAIGRPLPGTRAWVVDRQGALAPPGVAGELWLAGAGLARGYLGRPELTAGRFTPDPFGGPGERVYRTGDLVRQRPDGALEFLGRIDHQVKVRGFRIELGEIEEVLRSHPAVRECAVVARGDVLVAYVAGSADLPADILRSFLGERLPEFMVPSIFVTLDALPLSPNGKIDRRALPEPDRGSGSRDFIAPRTKTEETLAEIWRELLGLEQVGVEDRFFELGGHSLLATQVVSRVRHVLGVDLPLRDLFRHPTIAGLAELIDAQPVTGSAPAAPPLVPVLRGGESPLSFAQQRLWLIDQIEPGSPAYNMPFAVRLTGEASPALLERIFGEIVRRHEALRTTFALRGDRPVQVIAPELRVALPVIDLSHLPADQREARARRLARDEARRPFDLSNGPLLRAALVRLAARDHLLLVTLHHIVSDGWSMGVLLREIAALSAGRTLPELPVQYADFAVWQQTWLQGEVLEAQIGYWKQRLAGAPRLLELPLDRPRPAVQTWNGALWPVELPHDLSEAVQRLGRQEGTTPFMTLLAAWAVLLGRHAGQDDVLIGSPIAGRNRREIEDLIGFFVNTLVLRVHFQDAPTFGGLLGRVRQTALDGYAHQDVPFERIIEEVVSERDLAVSPLFQVLLTLQNAPAAELTVPGLSLAPIPLEGGIAKFDLSLSLGETPSGFVGALEYNTDLFDVGTAERLWARFTALLDAAAGDPSVSVADLPLLLPAERRQLLAWNETGEAPSSDLCLHELFAAQAARTPHATALIYGTERLTYAELAGRAGGIARHLLGLGIGPEARVAVSLERSPDLIAALLGVLAAGAAYVPVDPAYPEDRRAFMVEDSGAAVLWTGAEDVPSAELPVGLAAPGHLAYVIYTSGSTGRPKGVAIEHRSAVALARWARQEFSDEELGGMLAATSVCFDLSVFEIFVPLAFGGTILLAENALALPALPETGTVRLLNTVPSAAAELVRSGGIPASVETVCLAGEPLPGILAARLYATGTVRRVLNLYGPSEDTTYSTGALVLRDDPREPAIGRPLPGTRAWVVDRKGTLVPPGVAGELWLAGAGLARGYLGRPELTAGRFTPAPFGGPGERVYRTGDLVLQRRDGTLEFLGRIDHQVKVRGFRIELGEVEAALASHPAVRDSVVVVRGDVLVAYVAGSGDLPDAGAFRAFLGRRLPEFMVPSVFVVLGSLPRTPNGKVDRKALPAPDLAGRKRQSVPPRTKTERALAAIWQELLGLDRVGVDDRFFELGGHSLLATRILTRIRQVFGVDLPLREIFQHPTIAGLAGRIDAQDAVPAHGAGLAPDERIQRRTAADRLLPLSFSQERLWLIDQLEPGTPAYNMPMAVRLTGEVAPGLLARIFAEIVRRHEALRTTFASRNDRPVQVITQGTPPALPLIDLSLLPEACRETQALRLAGEEARRSFDLRRGPLLRLALVRLGVREHLLLVTLHHIVSDGWSMGVLFREIHALYGAFAQGLPSPLAELPVQYADFALWQRRSLQGAALDGQLDWWRKELAGAPAVLALPLDRSRAPLQSREGTLLPFLLPAGVTARLQELARREGLTSFLVLLAAFQAFLGRLGGQDDVLVGTSVANRRQLETEGLIGFFVNTLVLRGRPGSASTFQGFLERTRETALGAFEHQDAPFERLVEELVPDRDLSVAPLFQVFFSMQTASGAPASLPGLTLEALPVHSGNVHFDLSLDLVEAGNELRGSLEISRALFDRTTGQRMVESFAHLLRAAVETPELRIAEIPLLDEAQRHQILREWSEGRAEGAASILPLFERLAAEQPGAPALSQAGRRLTYGELDCRANQLAHRLRALGVGPETPVAVPAERSPELIIAFLGILKAGGAYVPIDPAYPEERRAFMLEDAGALVLTPELLADEDDKDGKDSRDEEQRAPEAGQLAYVLYTSGSTGRPNGVMGAHGALARYAEMVRPVYGIGPGDRVLQFCSTSFDTSLEEIVVCLTAGAELVLRTDAMLASVATFLETCRARGVTVLSLPTAYWHEIAAKLETDGLALPPCLRLIIIGGERALATRVAAWRRHAPERPRLLNSYGVTEATIVSTVADLAEPSASEARGEVSIGRALPGTEIFLLDPELEPAPIGTDGEMMIGGGGGAVLARGYLGRPDLTAERFVPHPFAPEPGARLYRTGDLARALSDGALEFVGRSDRQVKIRGYRIETREIEARLLLHPEVESAVVVVWEDRPGETIIAAYLVPRPAPGHAGPAPAALRAFVRETLPDYMVPAAFVLLDALPLSPNGKVDHTALPAPAWVRAAEHLGPRDSLELQLARIWEEVLGIDEVGVRDDFFALGGHSLLGVQVTSRIQSRLGRSVPLASLLRHPTVERLAALLREEAGPIRRTPLVELAPGSGTPLFLVHPVGGEVLCYVSLARRLGRPVYGLQAPEDTLSLEAMAALYLRHVREVQPEGPYLLGGWSLGGAVAYEMARQLGSTGETVERVILIDSYAPGDLWHEEVSEAALVASFAGDLARLLGIGGIALPEGFGDRGRDDALAWLGARAEEAGLLPPGRGTAELERRFATFAANHRAMAGYAGGPSAAPLLLVRATEPASVETAEPDRGWERVAGQPVEVHELPGDHYTLLQDPAVERLASLVRERLGSR